MNLFSKVLAFLVIIVCSEVSTNAQCVSKISTFSPGEKVTYQAYYNWGFIWIHAADVQFTINQKIFEHKQVYVFEASGNSLKSYDWMYKVRDKFQSYVDMENFNPLMYEQHTLEGGNTVNQTYTFSYPNRKIYTDIETNKKPRIKDSLNMTNCAFDVLSGTYFCRTINFEPLKKNDKIPLNLVIDGKIYPLFVRYLGKENVKIHDDKQLYRCIKFSVLLVEGTIFNGGEDMTVWVTDDENRIPVLVEAKILIGSVKAYLNTTQGLRYPLTSKIN